MAAGRAARRLRRLRTVQRRTFDYDGRGFLRWESHPELGMASFTYDARAHVTAKDQSAAETQFDLRTSTTRPSVC